VARPERFERPTPRFVVQKHPSAATLNCTPLNYEDSKNPLFEGLFRVAS
jgi:hypothetical protein